MRCFIAIDIDEPARTALRHLQQELAAAANLKKSDVKWVEPDNIHLTLKFLGEIKDKQVLEICDLTGRIAARYGGFDIDIEKVGHFGGRTAKVVWVGAGSEKLAELQNDLELHLAEAGFAEDNRPFTAHLTLCRVRNPRAGAKLAELLAAYKDFRLGRLSADSVCVYQSQLTAKGPVYTLLGNYNLQ